MRNKQILSIKLLAFFIAGFIFPVAAYTSNYYWVGGSGNWSDYSSHWATSSGGNVFQIQEPTPFDDVIFDANSFAANGDSVNVDATVFTCHNMSWTGVTHPSIFSGNSSSGTLEIWGSLLVDPSVTWTCTGQLAFKSTTPGQTIFTASKFINTIVFDGAGGWTLQDSLKTNSITLTNGILHTNNQYIRTGQFVEAGGTSSAYLGTSVIDITIGNYWTIANSQVTLDADSATINFSYTFASFAGGNFHYHHVNFLNGTAASIAGNNLFDNMLVTGDMMMNTNNIFDTLLFNNPGKTITLASGSTQTILNRMFGNGACSAPVIMTSSNAGNQATITKASGNVIVNYFQLRDINATGGATFTGNVSTILSNVNGWTINTVGSQNRYWVGGSGNWNDPMHWSTINGGPGGSCVPTLNDDVYFDTASFNAMSDSVLISIGTAYCRNMDWTGATGTPRFMIASSLEIYGSMKLIPAMTISSLFGQVYFKAITTGNNITTAAHLFERIYFDGLGGNWTLQDSLTANYITINNGTFYSNNQNLNCGEFYLIVGAADLGTSIITMYQNSTAANWNISSSATLNASLCKIYFTGNVDWFNGGNKAYNKIYFQNGGSGVAGGMSFVSKLTTDGPFTIDGNNTFDSLIFNNPGMIINLSPGTTETILSIMIGSGTCSGLTTMHTSPSTGQATFYKASGGVTLNYFQLENMAATGSATFTATNSVAISNVTGWNVFSSGGQNLYWVGDNGSWNDPMHWSGTSGGPGGSCVPTIFDDVFFDVNSFSTAGDSVNLISGNVQCHNMTWTGAQGNPKLMTTTGAIEIYGSMTLISAMQISDPGFINFQSSATGNTITSASQLITNIRFDGVGGSWILQDSLTTKYVWVNNGTLYSNNQIFNGGEFYLMSAADFGTSKIKMHNYSTAAYWNISPAATLNASLTTMYFDGSQSWLYGGNKIYNKVYFLNGVTGQIAGSNTFSRVEITGAFTMDGNNTFDTLFLNNAGKTILFEAGATQYIQHQLTSNAYASFPIYLQSDHPGQQVTISALPGDTICLDYIYMTDQVATGGAVFYAGTHSSNANNNLGWHFLACGSLIGMAEQEQEAGSFYPNPTSGKLIFTSHDAKCVSVEITDALGKVMETKSLIAGKIVELDLSGYADGIYFVRVELENGNYVMKKVIRN